MLTENRNILGQKQIEIQMESDRDNDRDRDTEIERQRHGDRDRETEPSGQVEKRRIQGVQSRSGNSKKLTFLNALCQ